MSPGARGDRGSRQRGERAMVPPAEFRSYYDRPVLKAPVWKFWIPVYFFSGGLAAGSSLLAEAAAWSGDAPLARRARVTALAAVGVSTASLVADLGRPARFHHMLRVAKMTSPMSVGSWLLAAYGPAAGVAALGERVGLRGVARVAGVAAAGLAPAVATYTGVLVADTAVPVWHDAYRELPFVFAGGAAASAGALGVLTSPRGSAPRPAVRLAILGALAELAATARMRRSLGRLVGEVYDTEVAGRLDRAARGATAVGAGLLCVPRPDLSWSRPRALRRSSSHWSLRLRPLDARGRGARNTGAVLVIAGAALQRFAVAAAGRQSARDPKYVVVPQRERFEPGASPGAVGSPS